MAEAMTIAGGVDLADLGQHLCVPFAVEPLLSARVLWLNCRWWSERGWDVEERDQRQRIERVLLRLFGVRSTDLPATPAESILYADRYGGTFGTAHGGSGRCGIAGGFHAKGIGRTPLVARGSYNCHANGLLPLAEAVREAVAGEIADAELPWGAVPAVAILCTGDAAEPGSAILIRPNFVRPAHFERSIYFGSAGTWGSDQHLDGLRVNEAVHAAEEVGERFGFPGLTEMFLRFADQIGACHAHRLWQGKFLTSNAAVTGALADFGSFRSVPSWHSFFGEPEEQFGKEPLYLETAFDSLARSFERRGRRANACVADVRARLRARVTASFEAQALAALQLEQASSATRRRVADLLFHYFQRQQRERRQIGDVDGAPPPWLHAALVAESTSPITCAEGELVDEITAAISADSSIDLGIVLQSLVQWTCPRPGLSYERTTDLLEGLSGRLAAEPDGGAQQLRLLIDDMLSRSWRKRPSRKGLVLKGQAVNGSSRIFYGMDRKTRAWLAIVESTVINGHARLFGQRLAVRRGASCSARRTVHWTIPSNERAMFEGSREIVEGSTVKLPPARFFYPSALCEQPAALSACA